MGTWCSPVAAGRLERGLNKQRSIRFIGERRRKIPPGESVWQHVADNLYAIRFKFFTLTQNVFTGWTIIAGETTVDATGETNAGSATVEVHAPNGVLVATACAQISGTRFEL